MLKKFGIKRGFGILSIALFALMIITYLSALDVNAEEKQHWADKEMNQWKDKGYLKGDADGGLRPDDNITRAEFVTLINRIKGFEKKSDKVVGFTDLPQNEWFYDEVAKALEAGIINGVSETQMNPNGFITREEAMTIVKRLSGAKENKEYYKLAKDNKDVSEWAIPGVSTSIKEGYISGSEGNIYPLNNIKRAEAIVLLNRQFENVRVFGLAGEYDLEGAEVNSIEILSGDITVKNTTVKKDVTIASQVGKAEATLKDIKVEGNLYANNDGGTIYLIDVDLDGKKIVAAGLNENPVFKDKEGLDIKDAEVAKATVVDTNNYVENSVVPQDNTDTEDTDVETVKSVLDAIATDTVDHALEYEFSKIKMGVYGRFTDYSTGDTVEKTINIDLKDTNLEQTIYQEINGYNVPDSAYDDAYKLLEKVHSKYFTFTSLKNKNQNYLEESRFLNIDGEKGEFVKIAEVLGLPEFRPYFIYGDAYALGINKEYFKANIKDFVLATEGIGNKDVNVLIAAAKKADRPVLNGVVVDVQADVDGEKFNSTAEGLDNSVVALHKISKKLSMKSKDLVNKVHYAEFVHLINGDAEAIGLLTVAPYSRNLHIPLLTAQTTVESLGMPLIKTTKDLATLGMLRYKLVENGIVTSNQLEVPVGAPINLAKLYAIKDQFTVDEMKLMRKLINEDRIVAQ